jgi:hypothetical protein
MYFKIVQKEKKKKKKHIMVEGEIPIPFISTPKVPIFSLKPQRNWLT